MAKRKRLAPPQGEYFGSASAGGDSSPLAASSPAQPSAPSASSPARRRSPIADVAAEASQQAAATELAETLHQARRSGRLVLDLPLGAIVADHLVRDRLSAHEEDMAVLKASLQARGQQTPIEVCDLGAGRYGLISGWRRLRALRDLSAEGGTDTVLAFLRRPEEASEAYLAMVEENEIRVGLSYYERARIVVKSVEAGVYPDTGTALRHLFAAASRAKRSKIGSFTRLVQSLDDVLRFPQALGERLGLALAQALEADQDLGSRLRQHLAAAPPDSAEAEQSALRAVLKAAPQTPVAKSKSESKPAKPAAKARRSAARELRPGLSVLLHPDGRLELAGEALTAELRGRLLSWLERQA